MDGQIAQVAKLYREHEYAKATKLGESIFGKVSEGKKPELMTLLGASHARGGNWERAKWHLNIVLDVYCDSTAKVFDKPEKLRVLAALELASGAAPKGDVELIRSIGQKCGKDFRTDYALIRDAEGTLVGKARLRDALLFLEAQALIAAGKPEEARPILTSLEAAKGPMLFNDKVFEMRDAVALLQKSLPATNP